MKIIKQELQFEKSLKQRIEFVCEFSKAIPKFVNGSIRKLEKTNISYVDYQMPICPATISGMYIYNKKNDMEAYIRWLPYRF